MTEEPPPRRIDLEIEVPGPPEQVWDAVATGPGMSRWMHPTEIEPRVGGLYRYDMGTGPVDGVVTVWEPPHRFADESDWTIDAGTSRLTTEWTIHPQDGGTCVVRMVMSGFDGGADWDDEIGGMTGGMRRALEALRDHLAGTPSPTALVLGVIVARNRAFAEKDAAAFAALYAPDRVSYALAPPLAQRGDPEEGMRTWFADYDGPVERRTRELTVMAGSDTAYAHALSHVRGVQGGQEVRLWFRETLAFRHGDDGWRIAHEHLSVPFEMDGSGRASLDLTP